MANSTKSPPRPWWVAIVCGMASYIDAAAIVGMSTAAVFYMAPLGLTPDSIGLIAGALTFGIAVGALVEGRLSDRFGRRPIFTLTMTVIIVASSIIVFVPSLAGLIIGAVLLGLGTGADLPGSLSTISEAATDRNRGKLLAFSGILWILGGIVTGFVAGAVQSLGLLGGQILIGHIGVLALIVMLGRLTIPESELWKAARTSTGATAVVSAGAEVALSRGRLRELLSKRYIAPFVALTLFYALVNLAPNTYGQFGSYIVVNILQVPVLEGATYGLIAVPFALGAALVFMRIVDTRFRFAFFIGGAITYVLAYLIPVVFGLSILTYILSGTVAAIGGAFAGESIMKYWTQVHFPTLLRTTAQGFVISFARFAAAGFAVITPAIIAAGASVLFIALSLVVFVGTAIAFVVFRRRDDESVIEAEEVAFEEISGRPAAI